MRRTIAKRLVQSKAPVPHFYLTVDVAVDRLWEAYRALREENYPVSLNDVIIKAAAVALRRHPEMNASFAGDHVKQYSHVHIGVAVAIDDGLITPVIRDADTKSLADIAAEAKALAERARNRRLQPNEYTGATFSISNLGMMGIDEFSAIINPPEAAILAVGAVREVPVVEGGQVKVGRRMKLTLSVDHRVADGAQARALPRHAPPHAREPAAAGLTLEARRRRLPLAPGPAADETAVVAPAARPVQRPTGAGGIASRRAKHASSRRRSNRTSPAAAGSDLPGGMSEPMPTGSRVVPPTEDALARHCRARASAGAHDDRRLTTGRPQAGSSAGLTVDASARCGRPARRTPGGCAANPLSGRRRPLAAGVARSDPRARSRSTPLDPITCERVCELTPKRLPPVAGLARHPAPARRGVWAMPALDAGGTPTRSGRAAGAEAVRCQLPSVLGARQLAAVIGAASRVRYPRHRPFPSVSHRSMESADEHPKNRSRMASRCSSSSPSRRPPPRSRQGPTSFVTSSGATSARPT